MAKYRKGQHVYILAANSIVQEVVVRKEADHIYTLALKQSGLLHLPEGRIYSSRESAEEHMKKVREDRGRQPSYLEKIAAGTL